MKQRGSTAEACKQYDRDYFDRWYRDEDHRVRDRAELRRKAALAVAAADHVLRRPVRTALDVGCGEARWRGELLRIRPRLRYLGLESSDYAIKRYGASRNVQRGSFGDLATLGDRRFDLLICTDVLHYLSATEIDRGLPAFVALVGGAAYIDAAVREDDPEGDLEGWHDRPAAWYRARLRRAGLVECGLGVWAPEAARLWLTELEQIEIG
ncbi:MAG: class I SAM-dependent methyltransferase [Acidobacteria bacterium]|nr:class I SAM-dependent methyltransferase [Acidobacteriota bacterium]